jgi:DNA-binding response OmpR family regulator
VNTSHVVIVDDQSSNRKVLSKLAATLEPGVRVESFADPLEALRHARLQTPDLLITDFKMPPIDGAELIRRFRRLSRCKAVPAVVVTAYDDVEYRVLALKAGANDFIISPLDHDRFREQSRKLLSMHRLEQLAPSAFEIISRQTTGNLGGPQIEMYNGLIENLAAQLLEKTREVSRLSTEMQRLADISETAAVFVDRDLLIRRFTPLASKIFAICREDIGRRFTDIASGFEYDDLKIDFERVMASGESFTRRLNHREGDLRYLLRIIPTEGEQGRPAGATLIIVAPFALSVARSTGSLH